MSLMVNWLIINFVSEDGTKKNKGKKPYSSFIF